MQQQAIETIDLFLKRGGKITIIEPYNKKPKQIIKKTKKNQNTKDYDYSNMSYPAGMEW